MATKKARTFNVDAKRAEVDESEVTIGGRSDLRPAPQTTALRSRIRALGVEQNKINVEARKLAEADDADDRLDEAAALDERAERVLYQMISALLVDNDGQNPDPEWLADQVPPHLAAPLIEFLQGGDDTDPS